MKKISAVMMTGIFLVLNFFKLSAQDNQQVKASSLPPYQLAITFNKTTNLIFPYEIKSVDKGSRDILVQKAIGVENILQVKAAKQGFEETNLTVVTADGSLYPYLVTYTDSTTRLSLVFNNTQVVPKPVAVFEKDDTTDVIAKKAKDVISRERTVDGMRDHDYDMLLDVKGIYVHDGVIYFQFVLLNNSAIDYDVQSMRLFIHDRKRSKRTASQELEMQPVYELGNINQIRHKSEQLICVALPKFTIPDKKYLAVQLMEKNGGRNLSLKINNKRIIKAIGI